MDKREVAQILEEIALLLEIQGENPFKVRAYHNAARALDGLDEELDVVTREGRLEEIEGIGKGIAEKIIDLVQKGKLAYYEKLRKTVPQGLLELMEVPGLGAKRIKKLYDELNVRNLADLTKACEKGQLSQLEGFGAKTESTILENLGKLKAYGKRMHWWKAGALALPLFEQLSNLTVVKEAQVAGSFRRLLETVGDLDFLVSSDEPETVMDWFTTQPLVEKVQSKGKTKSSVRLKGGLQADLRVVPEKEFPFALVYFTGSKEFSILLRRRAVEMGLSLNEYGFTPKKGRYPSEEAIFKALKLSYIPPELREGYEEIKAAERGKLPRLVEEGDIRGVFHCHTTDSDGRNTLEEMAVAARELGWEYLGISDHSKSSFQAGGMDEERLFAQVERIRKLKLGIHLFAGLECDILKDGSLDFPGEVLKELDFVIASVHSSFKMKEKEMTKRIIRAVENPYTTMLGHVTGRLLLRREPYEVNLSKVIDACIANDTIIELNAHPMRLDMDWRLWHKASERGLKCSINPDAHSVSDLRYYLTGVNVARKGWLEKKHILNTGTLEEVRAYLGHIAKS